jgi:hypothetical protein
MSVRALSRVFNLALDDWYPESVPQPRPSVILIDCNGMSQEEFIRRLVRPTYDILADDRRLREAPETFELQRATYPTRREFPAYSVKLVNGNETCARTASDFGFHLLP